MNRRPRTYYTDTQRALMWERWKAGWTLHQIGHLFDRPHTSIHNVLSRTGGIRPPERRRSKAALSLSEREEISRALVAGETLRSIAARLGRAPSTVSRELNRNGGREGYRATQADSAAWDRALRPKRCKLAENRALASVVADKLRCCGRLSRSLDGSSILIRATRATTCHTRLSIAVCSFKRVVP